MLSLSVFNTGRDQEHTESDLYMALCNCCVISFLIILAYRWHVDTNIPFGMWIPTSGKSQRCEPRPSVCTLGITQI